MADDRLARQTGTRIDHELSVGDLRRHFDSKAIANQQTSVDQLLRQEGVRVEGKVHVGIWHFKIVAPEGHSTPMIAVNLALRHDVIDLLNDQDEQIWAAMLGQLQILVDRKIANCEES